MGNCFRRGEQSEQDYSLLNSQQERGGQPMGNVQQGSPRGQASASTTSNSGSSYADISSHGRHDSSPVSFCISADRNDLWLNTWFPVSVCLI